MAGDAHETEYGQSEGEGDRLATASPAIAYLFVRRAVAAVRAGRARRGAGQRCHAYLTCSRRRPRAGASWCGRPSQMLSRVGPSVPSWALPWAGLTRRRFRRRTTSL